MVGNPKIAEKEMKLFIQCNIIYGFCYEISILKNKIKSSFKSLFNITFSPLLLFSKYRIFYMLIKNSLFIQTFLFMFKLLNFKLSVCLNMTQYFCIISCMLKKKCYEIGKIK